MVGPLDGALAAASEALLETDRCTYAAMDVLDADGNVNTDQMKQLLSTFTGMPKVIFRSGFSFSLIFATWTINFRMLKYAKRKYFE